MAYIGQKPGSNFRNVTLKDSFTGDGSTTAFDLSKSFNQAGQNDLEVFVDNVRQEPTAAYTVGQDDSGNFKRVTFTAAPASGATIYILNQGETSGVLTISDGSVTGAKLNADAITGQTELAEAPADTDTLLIHDASASSLKKIQASNLIGTSLITGKPLLDEVPAEDDLYLIYDTSAGSLKKVSKSDTSPVTPAPTAISPTEIQIDGGGTEVISITGTGFDSGAGVKAIGTDGSEINAVSVSFVNSGSLSATFTQSDFSQALEPYDIKVTNSTGTTGTAEDILYSGETPNWVTSAGSLGSVEEGAAASFTVEATDPDSTAITYSITSGSLPSGLSLNSSTGAITGTAPTLSSDTTYNFTITATDGGSQTTSRAFTITVTDKPTGGTETTYPSGSDTIRVHTFSSPGTFTLGSTKTLNYLVVGGGAGGGGGDVGSAWGGGGGGAGGLIQGCGSFPNASYPINVGCGSAGAVGGSDTRASNGQNSTFSTFTALGGGGGGTRDLSQSGNTPTQDGAPGGSGGGGSGNAHPGVINETAPGGTAQQSPGYGNPGGRGSYSGGGGGGAGAAGAGNPGTAPASDGYAGGVGRAYSISGTSVYYAGGGGGGGADSLSAGVGSGNPGPGGQGGGGPGGLVSGDPTSVINDGTNGTAKRGGGGGGGGGGGSALPGCQGQGGAGGKGVVIISYTI